MTRLLIIIPAYNEASMISYVIKSLPKKIIGISQIDILVIDDGSGDNTGAVAKQYKVILLRHLLNRGLGAALGTGFAYALKFNYDYAVTFDADGQHNPKDLIKIVKALIKKRADVVIGSRLISISSMPWQRKLINQISNILTYMLFNIQTTDSQSGLRGFSRKALTQVKIKSQKMEVSSEIFKEISRLKLYKIEIPVESVYSDYSLAKGQPISNAPAVFWKLLLHRFI